MSENTIKSVAALVELRKRLDAKWWFRGQRDSTWTLTPKVFRQKSFTEGETAMINEFRQGASFRSGVHPQGEWEWCVFAQHYGIPTRLMDWTLNPLQALFFAVEKTNDDEVETDSSFFALNAKQLNENTLGHNSSFPLLLESAGNLLEDYRPGREKRENLPVAVIAESNFSRINAQHGVFTIIPHRTYEDDTMNGTCQKWIIPKEFRGLIRKELEFLGVNDSTTYPDLEHFAKRIAFEYSGIEDF